MITTARIKADLQPTGLDWISAFRSDGLRKILDGSETGDGRTRIDALIADDVVEVISDHPPRERIMVCLNERLMSERSRKREVLLSKSEQALEGIARSVRYGKTVGTTRIARRVGAEVNRWKMAKLFEIDIGERHLTWARLNEKIAAEAKLDGSYAIRTNLDEIESHQTVAAYKSLSQVEWAFRLAKSVLNVRPIYVYSAEHVRAHVFLCMLAHYVQWHMRQRLAPLLFEDDNPDAAKAQRQSPVGKAQVSESAKSKSALKKQPTVIRYTVCRRCWMTYRRCRSIRFRCQAKLRRRYRCWRSRHRFRSGRWNCLALIRTNMYPVHEPVEIGNFGRIFQKYK